MSGGEPPAKTSAKNERGLPKITDPILKAITGAGVALGTVKTFVAHLLLPPFWEDSIVAALLLASSLYWLLELRESFSSGKSHGWTQLKKSTSTFALLAIQIGLCICFLLPPLGLLVRGRWSLCGTFVIDNPQGACLIGYDARDRDISDMCADFDQAGWVRESPQHWWIYRPHSVTIRRSGTADPKFVLPSDSSNDVFSPNCRAVVYPK